MSRRTRILPTSIVLGSVGMLLVACGDNSDVKSETSVVSGTASAGSPQPEESSTTAEAAALPDGVLPLPATPDGQEPAPLDAGRPGGPSRRLLVRRAGSGGGRSAHENASAK
jgi:hypothetical protein